MRVRIVIVLSERFVDRANVLAESFNIPLIDGTSLAGAKSKFVDPFIISNCASVDFESSFAFLYDADGLSLAQVSEGKVLRVKADFCGSTVNYRRRKGGGKGQMIAKAIGSIADNVTTVLDATAGLGGDAFVLASLGCRMTLLERVPEVRALLEDGLRVAREWGAENDPTLVEVLDRMHLIESDATDYFTDLDERNWPEVVYLDPMFPIRKKSALVKKEMRVFHSLVGADPDADHLLGMALVNSKRRVVVKRPRIADALAGRSPSYSLEGKSNRYDVYSAQLVT